MLGMVMMRIAMFRTAMFRITLPQPVLRRLWPLLLLALCGCDFGLVQMGTTEYGVLFRMLPPSVGGGVAQSVIQKGQTVVVWPWDRVYRFDTKVKSLEWGEEGAGSEPDRFDYVQTRARDGNEVALAVKIEYQIVEDPEQLVFLAQHIATSKEKIDNIVIAVARADIRTYMNQLATAEFFENKAKYEGEKRVQEAMQERLNPFGIKVLTVNLKEHRFERMLDDGTVDRTYQEKINEVQTVNEETGREELRIETVRADKRRKLADAQATVNRQLEEAEGYLKQAKLRGDAYLESRSNEAKGIFAKGQAEVKGIREQVEALSGPGGEEILKLEIAKQLLKSAPRFVVVEESGQGMRVDRLDTNELLQQIGIVEGLAKQERNRDKEKKAE